MKINSGEILGLKLDHNFGYTFLKVVNFNELTDIDMSTANHIAFYSYDYFLEQKKDFDLIEFKNSEEFVGPILTIDIHSAIKNRFFTKMEEHSELREYEKKIPDMKGFSTKAFTSRYEKDATLWRYFTGGIPYKWIVSNYESLKHLERNTLLSYNQIAMRLTMECIHRKGEDVSKFYDLNDSMVAHLYYNMIYTEPYNKVPDKLKNRAS